MKINCLKYLIALSGIVFSLCLKAQSFKLDLRTPQGVFDALHYAANSRDTTILKFLCPPKVELFELNGDHRQICRCDSWVVKYLDEYFKGEPKFLIGQVVSRKVIGPQIEEVTCRVLDIGARQNQTYVDEAGFGKGINLYYCFGNYYLRDF